MTKILKNLKNIIIIALLAIIAILCVVMIIPKERKVTDLERISINEFTDSVMRYMEEIDRKSSNDDFIDNSNLAKNNPDGIIAYALEYAYSEQGKTSLSTKEIKALITKIFDIKVKANKLNEVGISPYLLEKHIDHDPSSQSYTIYKDRITKREIANTPIAKYIQRDIKVIDDGYEITFDKYVAKGPHDVIPRATASTTGINDYLNGKASAKIIKNIMTEDIIDDVATKEKETVITVALKNDQLIIKSIK